MTPPGGILWNALHPTGEASLPERIQVPSTSSTSTTASCHYVSLLCELLWKREWEEASQRIHATQETHLPSKLPCFSNGACGLPLHLVCAMRPLPPFFMVEMILKRYPAAAQQKASMWGLLPLHLAADLRKPAHQPPTSLFPTTHMKQPQHIFTTMTSDEPSIVATDTGTSSALSGASSVSSSSESIILSSVGSAASPDQDSIENSTTRHRTRTQLQETTDHCRVVHLLLEFYPTALHEREEFQGMLPLHICASSTPAVDGKLPPNSAQIAQLLLHYAPETMIIQDYAGDTPLVLAERSNSTAQPTSHLQQQQVVSLLPDWKWNPILRRYPKSNNNLIAAGNNSKMASLLVGSIDDLLNLSSSSSGSESGSCSESELMGMTTTTTTSGDYDGDDDDDDMDQEWEQLAGIEASLKRELENSIRIHCAGAPKTAGVVGNNKEVPLEACTEQGMRLSPVPSTEDDLNHTTSWGDIQTTLEEEDQGIGSSASMEEVENNIRGMMGDNIEDYLVIAPTLTEESNASSTDELNEELEHLPEAEKQLRQELEATESYSTFLTGSFDSADYHPPIGESCYSEELEGGSFDLPNLVSSESHPRIGTSYDSEELLEADSFDLPNLVSSESAAEEESYQCTPMEWPSKDEPVVDNSHAATEEGSSWDKNKSVDLPDLVSSESYRPIGTSCDSEELSVDSFDLPNLVSSESVEEQTYQCTPIEWQAPSTKPVISTLPSKNEPVTDNSHATIEDVSSIEIILSATVDDASNVNCYLSAEEEHTICGYSSNAIDQEDPSSSVTELSRPVHPPVVSESGMKTLDLGPKDNVPETQEPKPQAPANIDLFARENEEEQSPSTLDPSTSIKTFSFEPTVPSSLASSPPPRQVDHNTWDDIPPSPDSGGHPPTSLSTDTDKLSLTVRIAGEDATETVRRPSPDTQPQKKKRMIPIGRESYPSVFLGMPSIEESTGEASSSELHCTVIPNDNTEAPKSQPKSSTTTSSFSPPGSDKAPVPCSIEVPVFVWERVAETRSDSQGSELDSRESDILGLKTGHAVAFSNNKAASSDLQSSERDESENGPKVITSKQVAPVPIITWERPLCCPIKRWKPILSSQEDTNHVAVASVPVVTWQRTQREAMSNQADVSPATIPYPVIERTISEEQRDLEAAIEHCTSKHVLSELTFHLQRLREENEAHTLEKERLKQRLSILSDVKGISVVDLRTALQGVCDKDQQHKDDNDCIQSTVDAIPASPSVLEVLKHWYEELREESPQAGSSSTPTNESSCCSTPGLSPPRIINTSDGIENWDNHLPSDIPNQVENRFASVPPEPQKPLAEVTAEVLDSPNIQASFNEWHDELVQEGSNAIFTCRRESSNRDVIQSMIAIVPSISLDESVDSCVGLELILDQSASSTQQPEFHTVQTSSSLVCPSSNRDVIQSMIAIVPSISLDESVHPFVGLELILDQSASSTQQPEFQTAQTSSSLVCPREHSALVEQPGKIVNSQSNDDPVASRSIEERYALLQEIVQATRHRRLREIVARRVEERPSFDDKAVDKQQSCSLLCNTDCLDQVFDDVWGKTSSCCDPTAGGRTPRTALLDFNRVYIPMVDHNPETFAEVEATKKKMILSQESMEEIVNDVLEEEYSIMSKARHGLAVPNLRVGSSTRPKRSSLLSKAKARRTARNGRVKVSVSETKGQQCLEENCQNECEPPEEIQGCSTTNLGEFWDSLEVTACASVLGAQLQEKAALAPKKTQVNSLHRRALAVKKLREQRKKRKGKPSTTRNK